MPPISVRRANADDRPMVQRLWLMFRHDMSEFGGQLPNPDGTFRPSDWSRHSKTGTGPATFSLVRRTGP